MLTRRTGDQDRATNRAVMIAMMCAAVMIAQQVASKALRDALFLSEFDVTTLPLMLTGSAILSIGVVLLMSRALSVFSPAKVSPLAFAASGVLLLLEWALASAWPRGVTVLIYIHIAVLGSVLISSFWSVVNERFDPRTAKRRISRIASGATAGGLLGGILAERFAFYFPIVNLMPVLALMQAACAICLLRVHPAGSALKGASIRKVLSGASKAPRTESGFRVLMRVGYLRNLALVVLLSNFAAVLLDYLLKSQVAHTIAAGGSQMRFFALFYTLVSLVTFGIQMLLSNRFLQKPDSIGRTMAIRPGMALLGGLALLPGMNLMTVAVVRGLEAALQSSLFRSAYELLYNPIVPEKKRTTKPIVDVGCDRLGDAFGGGFTKLILLLPVAMVNAVLVGAVVLAAFVVLIVMRTLQGGYTRALEKSLLAQDRKLGGGGGDRGARLAETHSSMQIGLSMSMTMSDITAPLEAFAQTTGAGEARAAGEGDGAEAGGAARAGGAGAGGVGAGGAGAAGAGSVSAAATLPDDPLLGRIAALRSGDPRLVKTVLRSDQSLNPTLAPFIIPLLAWDAVSTDASISLCSMAPEITGQLVDRLLDHAEEFAIRRRIPRILGTCDTERAAQGLLDGCLDNRFEVRYRAGAALAQIHQRHPEIRIDRDKIFRVVLREVKVDRRVWEGERRLLDKLKEGDTSPFLDDVIQARTNRSMEHVFTLLSLVLPNEPLRIAYRGLHTDDANLRGTALEYLESVLPTDIRRSLWPFLEGAGPQGKDHADRSEQEILEDLLKSNPSIEMNLEELRKRMGESG